MASWLRRWFGYGLGVGTAKAIFGDDAREPGGRPAREPIHEQTEAEIRADEARYDEDAKRLEAEDAADKEKRRGGPG